MKFTHLALGGVLFAAAPANAEVQIYSGRIIGTITSGSLYDWDYESSMPPLPVYTSMVGQKVWIDLRVTRDSVIPPGLEWLNPSFFEEVAYKVSFPGPLASKIDSYALGEILQGSSNIAEYLTTPFSAIGPDKLRFQYQRSAQYGVFYADLSASLNPMIGGTGTISAQEGIMEYNNAVGVSFNVIGGYFGAVPEPKVWMTLILGFAVAGASMRSHNAKRPNRHPATSVGRAQLHSS